MPKVVKEPVKKAEVKKPVVRKAKAVTEKPVVTPVVKAKKEKVSSGLTVALFTPDGKEDGTITLPESYFGAKENPVLVAQAVRVYLANQREGSAQAKTRGEVEGSTRKIYKQKGTGRARHGGIRAPIFVGGGIVFGPRAHEFTMDMPKKMSIRALASALTTHTKSGEVKVVAKLETVPKKTKSFAQTLHALSITGKTLFLLAKEELELVRSIRNLDGVHVLPVLNTNTYEVVTHSTIIFTPKAVQELESRAL
jgi:large subunit ribosomal protein L4